MIFLKLTCDFLLLFLDNLLVLESDKLLLLFKVLYYLGERLFEYLNLALEDLDLLLLLLASLVILIRCAQGEHHVSLECLILILHLQLLPLVVVERVPLRHGLLSELLIFMMDVPLDVLDV